MSAPRTGGDSSRGGDGARAGSESGAELMLDFLGDDRQIELMATLIAKLERLRVDPDRTSVFRTPWGRALFAECARSLGAPPDLDAWYRRHAPRGGVEHAPADLAPWCIEANWMPALMSLEIECRAQQRAVAAAAPRSVLRALHGVLDLEDRTQDRLAEYCKKERRYDYEGIWRAPLPGRALIAAGLAGPTGPATPARPAAADPAAPAPAPEPSGDADRLLRTTRPSR